MTEDVSTTRRKPLSKRQRLALFEREKGLCCVCGLKIVGDFIDEHVRPLGLGGSNDGKNRGIAHPKCAAVKTQKQDMPAINKAKRQKQAAHGIKDDRRAKIKSDPDALKAPAKDRTPSSKERIGDGSGRWLFGRWVAYFRP